MKISFYILLSLIFLVSCNEKEKQSDNLTEININFSDYNQNEHKSFIDLKIVNAIDAIEQQLKILDNGTASYTFINDRKKEVLLNYEGREFSLIVSPNETVNIELIISELLDRKSKWGKLKITSGENIEANNLILANTFHLDSLINQSSKPYIKDSLNNNLDYKSKRISEMKSHLQNLNDLISLKNITDTIFINWAKAKIKYRAGYDLTVYPFSGKSDRDLNVDDEYFSFIDQIGFNSNDQIIFKTYLDYLGGLTNTFIIITNISNSYKEKRENQKNNLPTNYFLKLELFKKLPKGESRNIMMAYLFKDEIRLSNYTGKEIPENYRDSLKTVTSLKYVEQLENKQDSQNKTINTLIAAYGISQKEKKELLKLYEGTENKVVFHDFWFTNCAPCMKELPNYNDLISTIDEKNVEFIFYGVYMESDEWQKTIDKFSLKGKHHLLTKNQLAFFEKYFGVNSFPHHHLIKSNGKIGEKIPFGTYPNNFDAIKKMIDKHKAATNTAYN